MYGFADLFKFKSLRIDVIGACIYYFAINMHFYGTSFAVAFIGLDVYTSAICLGAADVIGISIGYFVCDKVKRRPILFWGGLASASFAIMLIFVSDVYTSAALTFISRGICAFNYGTVWIFFPELFPATIKSIATGFIKNCGLVAVISSPYLIHEVVAIGVPPVFMLGCVYFLCTFAILLTRETFGKELLGEIKEIAGHRSSVADIKLF